ncbi:MAG: hypothetical protein HRT69_09340 [Flavobacteriaceae bacterium]|nr:hypothetical protein [Flavobacteriaceae bacterium]
MKIKIKNPLTLLLSITMILLLNFPLFGQENTDFIESTKTKEQSNDYKELENERLKIIAEMYSMMYEISGLFTELERAQSLEKSVSDYDQKTLDGIDSSNFTVSDRINIQRLEEIKSQIIMPELKTVGGQDLHSMKSITVTEGFRRIIENKVQAILKKTDQLSSVGTKVTELNNTSFVSQNFKKQISWSFAILVAIVIIGFFIIAYKDDEIRKTIFSGDAGLQFITIFSIIIAIILFGITGVLGGKELSALIGGISGFILGRSSIPAAKKEG